MQYRHTESNVTICTDSTVVGGGWELVEDTSPQASLKVVKDSEKKA